MDMNAQDHRELMEDEFEPIELGSVSEETKGAPGQIFENTGQPVSMP
ncbi:hypothetical protein NRY95_05380 [Xanthomonas campestris pv. phormiicola]|nr:hypothetical protein [Xanthomonas campestris pv. phormiicola]UYC17395.1 hypothetical protein NRY95_05380 [Xanthomonas campestris pv. phormiicola]